MPNGRRSTTVISIVDGSTRLSDASATHGESRMRWRYFARSAVMMFVPYSPWTSCWTSPADRRTVPRTVTLLTCSTDAFNTSEKAVYIA